MMLRWRIWLTARASAMKRDTISGSTENWRLEHLDRDALADQRVDAPVDGAEAALPELALDPVLADLLARLEVAVNRNSPGPLSMKTSPVAVIGLQSPHQG